MDFLHFYTQRTMDFLSNFSDLTFEFKPPLITILLVTLIALVFEFLWLKFSPLPGKKLPPGSFGFPLLGESVSFVRAQKQDRTDEWMQTRIDKYGPMFKTSLLGSKMVVLTGQAGNRFVFSGSDNGISFNQPSTVAKILGKYNLFEISGPQHKLIRGAISNFYQYRVTCLFCRLFGDFGSSWAVKIPSNPNITMSRP